MADSDQLNLQTLTADIVAAYVANNSVSSQDLAALIGSTYQALSAVGAPPAPAEAETPKADKAAIKKSISPDHLTSFIDGRRYKSLKRHLTTSGHTPDSYRQRYGLPHDYPMVASAYSAQRSELARSIGLGRKATAEKTEAAPEPAAKPVKRGRKAAAEG